MTTQNKDYAELQRDGEQLAFTDFSDWFIKINDPITLWELQPTYILAQVTVLAGTFITLIHALKNGQRLPYLWLAAFLHGIVVEIVCYNLPDVDNFWHSQALVMLLGRRLPVHIVGLYPVFIYNAAVAVSRMKLPNWAEPFAVGLTVVLIDIPYDIVSVKFVHWTWHDTDPNIFDRHYWVPWNSYYFHLCFTASLVFWFHFWHRFIGSQRKWEANSVSKELLCTVLAALLGMPCGVLLFLPYHPLHDIALIHSEVTFMILFAISILIVWSADRNSEIFSEISSDNYVKWIPLLISYLLSHYALFLGMVLFGNPENEVSIGLHEPIGPCNETVSLITVFGSILKKRRYLCPSDYDEGYFDFSCAPKSELSNNSRTWYTLCGKHFENRIEYVAILGTICLVAFVVFRNMYSKREKKVVSKKND